MSIVVTALAAWTVVFLLLKLANVLSDDRLSRALRRRHVSLKFPFVAIQTTALNASLEAAGRRHRRFLIRWFSLAVPIAAAGLILSVVLLAGSLLPPSPFSATPSDSSHFATTPISSYFRQRPRLLLHARAPWWLPRHTWNLLLARDHHPSDLHPRPHLPHTARVIRRPIVRRRRRRGRHLLQHSQRPHHPPPPRRLLTPLIPGVTVPAGDLAYILVAVSVAAVLHELGHALAAAASDARVAGVGAFIALAVPGAYVRLLGVEDLSTLAQLRVYCAGVWHNLVSALLALATVLALPALMKPAYRRGVGALVVDVPATSPLYDHISPGDIILRMGPFAIADGGPSFRHAVANLIESNHSVGFCVPASMFADKSPGATRCCNARFLQSYAIQSTSQCFREQGRNHTVACLDPAVVSAKATCAVTTDCVPRNGQQKSRDRATNMRHVARPVAERDKTPLRPALDHFDELHVVQEKCVMPVLPGHQQLIDVRVLSASTGKVVHFFYQGFAYVLGQSVTVSSYVPRFWRHVPAWMIHIFAVLDVPNIVERVLQYFSSVSFGLAVMNMAPVLYFDGEATSGLFVQLIVSRLGLPNRKVGKARAAIVATGSALVVLNVLHACWTLGL